MWNRISVRWNYYLFSMLNILIASSFIEFYYEKKQEWQRIVMHHSLPVHVYRVYCNLFLLGIRQIERYWIEIRNSFRMMHVKMEKSTRVTRIRKPTCVESIFGSLKLVVVIEFCLYLFFIKFYIEKKAQMTLNSPSPYSLPIMWTLIH